MQHAANITGTLVNGYLATGAIIPSLNEPEYRCPCCGSYGLARDDMADNSFWLDEYIAAFIALYGAGVCNTCADDHVETEAGIRHRDRSVYCERRDCWITEELAYQDYLPTHLGELVRAE